MISKGVSPVKETSQDCRTFSTRRINKLDEVNKTKNNKGQSVKEIKLKKRNVKQRIKISKDFSLSSVGINTQ